MHRQIKYQLREKGYVKKRKSTQLPKDLEQRLAELPTASAVVLGIIAVAGLTSIAVFAPNALLIFGIFLRKKTGYAPSRQEIETKLLQTVYYLKKTGKISIGETNGSIWFRLSNKFHKKQQEKINIDSLNIPKPKTWDKTYWLVAGDIPSKPHRVVAELLRRNLLRLGFYPLQRTMWLFPYNPKTELNLLLKHFNIAQFVTLMHVSELDNQDSKLAIAYWKERNIF